ncbi:MAG: ABC transporter substrate-binding protein, partial [Eubacteriales bacterium]
NTGVRISLVSYDQYNNEDNEYTGAVTQLNNDIITGNLPDIILLNSQLPVESYFQKGIFADLNQFIDDEEVGIDRSNYLSNVLDACTVDGKLYSMIMSFSIRTLFAKSEFVGNEPGWTFEEMMQCINNMPEGMVAFFDSGREDIINNFFSNSMGSFVNWDTGETYFESQGFIDFIKYLAQCPEKGYWERYYDSLGDNYVYYAEAENEMWQNYELRFYTNKALFSSGYISSFTDMLYSRNNFATKDVTAIGYPANSGNGAIIYPNIELAISQKSAVKKQAWDVLKFFLNDEDISNRTYNFSINITNLNNMASKAQDNYYYYDNSNDDFSYYKENGYSDDYIEYLRNSNQPFDQEVVDITMNLIKNATEVARSDSDLLDIVKEELSSFFGGTKSAEEAAKIIASRAKIYISENS